MDPESTPTSTGLQGRAIAGVMNDGSGAAHILVLAAVSDGKRLAPMLIEFATQGGLTHLGELAPASDSINSSREREAGELRGTLMVRASGADSLAPACRLLPAVSRPLAPARGRPLGAVEGPTSVRRRIPRREDVVHAPRVIGMRAAVAREDAAVAADQEVGG